MKETLQPVRLTQMCLTLHRTGFNAALETRLGGGQPRSHVSIPTRDEKFFLLSEISRPALRPA